MAGRAKRVSKGFEPKTSNSGELTEADMTVFGQFGEVRQSISERIRIRQQEAKKEPIKKETALTASSGSLQIRSTKEKGEVNNDVYSKKIVEVKKGVEGRKRGKTEKDTSLPLASSSNKKLNGKKNGVDAKRSSRLEEAKEEKKKSEESELNGKKRKRKEVDEHDDNDSPKRGVKKTGGRKGGAKSSSASSVAIKKMKMKEVDAEEEHKLLSIMEFEDDGEDQILKNNSTKTKNEKKLGEVEGDEKEAIEKVTPLSSSSSSSSTSSPSFELPSILNKDGGEYEWREEDCEEARCYEYSRVWYSQPAHVDAWKNEGSSLEVIKERTYGEVTMEGMMCLFEEIGINSKDTFVDIGSGLGNLVLWASFVKGAKKAYGIEIQLNRHVAAQQIRDDLALLRKPYWDPNSSEFIYTEHTELDKCPNIDKVLGESTIIFCNNILFNSKTMNSLLHTLYERAQPNALFVFTSDPFPRKRVSYKIGTPVLKFWKSIEVNDACSWCSKNLKFFFYLHPLFAKDPQPHFIYHAPTLKADSWIQDPNDNILFSGQEQDKKEGGSKKLNSSSSKNFSQPKPISSSPKFITKQSIVSISDEEFDQAKERRRKGIIQPSLQDTKDIPLIPHPIISSSKPSSSSSPAPKPLFNLLGEQFSFLVPSDAIPSSNLQIKIYTAFNAARKSSLRKKPIEKV
jgi:hypothetical protein